MKNVLLLAAGVVLCAACQKTPTITVAAPAAAVASAPTTTVAAPAAAAPVAAPAAAVPVAAAAVAKAGDPPLIPVGTKTKCAVTGEEFTVTAKTAQTVYAGKRYAFCCPDCAPQFTENPKKYAKN